MRKLALGILLLASACSAPVKQLPPIIPSPVPPMPVPPSGAAVGMYIPPTEASGERPTPNRGLGIDESIWHFRSAYNVAALNCMSPAHRHLADDYNRFIAAQRTRLTEANKAVDAEFIRRYPGTNGLRVRDTHMTDIYNYFALPPVTSGFCDLMLKKAVEAQSVSDAQLGEFSKTALGEIDDLFIDFYDAYERYQRRLADWKALYGRRGKVTVESGTP